MSSLQRYRKPGGFIQLLSLIETFGRTKQVKFLEMIELESPAWATALREKILTLDRLAAWPEEPLGKVLKRMPLKSQAYVVAGAEGDLKTRLEATMSGSEKRRLTDVLDENTPKPEELASVLMKFIEVARRMLVDRDLSAEKFDVSLMIAGDVEARLDDPAGSASGTVSANVAALGEAVQSGASAGSGSTADLNLQRRVIQALKENQALKDEVRALRDRLDQIRRIA